MFRIPLFILGLLFIYSFSSPNKIGNVFIKYDNLVEGYRVSIKFTPKVVYYEDHIIGRGTIYFHHIKTNQRFKIYNPMMGFPIGVLPIKLNKNKKWIVSIKKHLLKLKYNADYTTTEKNKFGNFGTTKVPFFFQDVNLDGSKELVIPKLNSGQRGVAIFKLYEVKNGKLLKNKNSFSMKKPCSMLDEMTKFYPEKRQIIQHCSGGYKGSYDTIYLIN